MGLTQIATIVVIIVIILILLMVCNSSGSCSCGGSDSHKDEEHLTLVTDCYTENTGCFIACRRSDNTFDMNCYKACRTNSPVC